MAMTPGKRARREVFRLMDELYGFLYQSNISERNIQRIKVLAQHPDANINALADVVLEIARVKPGKRRRIRVIAERHWDLFVRMVVILDEGLWDDFFFANGDQGDCLRERWEKARLVARFQSHGRLPCWCGSGRPYWHCCAERDGETAEYHGNEEREREWALNAASIPWWHPGSGVDHFTRSAYEMFYIDPDHPLAMTPPEWRDDEVNSTPRKKRHGHLLIREADSAQTEKELDRLQKELALSQLDE